MKNFLNKFKRADDGIVSLEFALVAPMLIFGSLFAINLGYQVNTQQKVAASMSAGHQYLQDYLMENNLEDLRPNFDNDTGSKSDTNLISTIKKVIEKASNEKLELKEIYVDTYCACPSQAGINSEGQGNTDGFEIAVEPTTTESSEFDFTDPTKDFYTRTNMSLWKKGELCSFDCPVIGGRARVIMELQVYHRMKDLFGKESYVHQKIETRVR